MKQEMKRFSHDSDLIPPPKVLFQQKQNARQFSENASKNASLSLLRFYLTH